MELEQTKRKEAVNENVSSVVSNRGADPALWEVNEDLREYFAANPMTQNDDGNYNKSMRLYAEQRRFMSSSIFHKKLVNGETVKLSWLVYSHSTGRVFCGPCKLYAGATSTAALSSTGFNDWKNSSYIVNHEGSKEHRECLISFLNRSRDSNRIDTNLSILRKKETQYWRNVLQRVVEVIKFLTSRGLPFRGENETFGSNRNGNFLGCIELLGKFDPFIADHVARYGNKGKGVPSYLSSTTVDEFISVISEKVIANIVADIKKSKYFSIIVDSTPDIANVDQLTFVIRYVDPDGSPKERFLKFIPNCGHKGADMENSVVSTLEDLNIDINNCRGQSYDNASNMSGVYKGLQKRIKDKNNLAKYVPCAGHSLQLVGSTAAESSPSSVEFFAVEQQLYNFFHGSSKRWEILLKHCDKGSTTVKSLSKTRWSARADASKTLYNSYKEIVAALSELCSSEDETKETQTEAKNIMGKLETLEMGMMICFWHKVLDKFQKVNVSLQAENQDLDGTVDLYQSVTSFVSTLRDEAVFLKLEQEAKTMTGVKDYAKDKRRKKKIKIPYGDRKEGHTDFDGHKYFLVNCYYAAIDVLVAELVRRKDVYDELLQSFKFLWNLEKMNENTEIEQKAMDLIKEYPLDLGTEFSEEIIFLKDFLLENGTYYAEEEMISKLLNKEGKDKKIKINDFGSKPYRLLKYIVSKNLQCIYPNTSIALRIFLSMAVTNCTGERSFSSLKRVKNYLRSTLSQEKLNDVAVLYIESEYVDCISFDDVVETFSSLKTRKKDFN